MKKSTPVRTTRNWLPHAMAILAVVALALLAYSNSFGTALVMDNGPLILGDARVHDATPRNLDLILNQQYWFGIGTSNLYRPLTTLSFLFNYAILGHGPQPAGYHWLNFLLHAVNIALLYLLALRLFRDRLSATLMAAVWAVHPVLTESVTNIVGRSDLLAAMAILGGLYCHIAAATTEGRRRRLWLATLFAAVTLGIFSKESAIVILAVMALYDFTVGAPVPDWRRRAVHYAMAAIPCAAFLLQRERVVSKTLAFLVPFTDNPLATADFWTARFTAVKILGKYLALLVWPATLSADYSYNQIPLFSGSLRSLEDWKMPAALLVFAALAAVALAMRRRKPMLSFFIGLVFLALAPTANLFLIIGTPMAERFLYVPAIALAGCLVMAVRAVSRPQRASAILALVAVSFAVRTYARNSDWTSETSIMQSAAEAAPDSFKPHMALVGLLHNPARQLAEAAQTHAILDSLPDSRNSMKSYTTTGIFYREQGDRVGGAAARPWYEKSLRDLQRARSISETFDRLMQQQNLLAGKGKTNFGWFPVYLELGRTLQRLQRPAEALDVLQRGRLLEFRPDFFEEMSNAWLAMGDQDRAAVVLMEGVTLDSTQAQLAAKLKQIYQHWNPPTCALRDDGLNMECPLVKSQLCQALRNVAGLYGQIGRQAQAEETARLRLDMACPTL